MTQAIADKKPPYLLMYIVTLVYLVVTAFFEEGVAYFDPVYTTLMSSTEFYLTFSLCVVLFLTEIYIAKHYFRIGINWVFFSFSLFLFIIDVVAVFSFQEWTAVNGVYHVTDQLRIRYVVFWLAACMAFYVFFAIMPKSVRDASDWNFYYLGGLFIALVAVVYSYFAEYRSYVIIFSHDYLHELFPRIMSFTNNKNTYGTLLFIGIACSLILQANTKKWWYGLLCLFLFGNQFIIFSKTALLCSFVFVLLFIIWFFIKSVKVHPARSVIYLVSVFVVLLFPIIAFSLKLFSSNSYVASFYFFVNSTLNSTEIGIVSALTSRAEIWSRIFSTYLETPTLFIFGAGDWNFSWFLGVLVGGSAPYIESAHSGFVDVFGRLGFFGLLIYIALIVYFIAKIHECFKNKRYGSFLYLSLFICLLLHSLTEDTNFMNMQAKDMMVTFMAFMPVLTMSYFDKKPEKAEDWATIYATGPKPQPRQVMSAFDFMNLSFLILLPIFAVLFGFSGYFSIWSGSFWLDSVFFQLQTLLIFLFVPFQVFSLAFFEKRKTHFQFKLFLSFDLLWIASCVLVSVFVTNVLAFLILLLSGATIVIIGLIGIDRASLKHAFISFAFFTIFECILISISKIIVVSFLAPDEAFQPYAIMCLAILDIILIFGSAVFYPSSKRFFGSLYSQWCRIEVGYSFVSYSRLVKRDIRFLKSNKKEAVLRCQK